MQTKGRIRPFGLRAHALWLDSALRTVWHNQEGNCPHARALYRSAAWTRTRTQYELWAEKRSIIVHNAG